jgi:hypothetical protein
MRVKTGHPRLRSDSYETLSTENLDPGESPTRTTQGRAGRPPLTHLLTDKAFNTTTPTNVRGSATSVRAVSVSNPTFCWPSRYGGKKSTIIHATSNTVLPSTTPQLTKRQPPRPGFLRLGIIRSSSTPSATPRPDLDRCWSTKDQHSHVGYRGSHVRHSTRDISPSRHQHCHGTPGVASHYQGTSLQQIL